MFYHVKIACYQCSQWDSHYVVLELIEGGSVLIYDIRSGTQLKINSHRLKPYLTLERVAPTDMVNLYLPEVQEDVTTIPPPPHR